jgi:hypothetical protein
MTGRPNDAFLANLETQLVVHRLTVPGPVARTRASFMRLANSLRGRLRMRYTSEQTEGSHT